MLNKKAYLEKGGTKTLILENCMIAESFWERFRGLMMKARLDGKEGLLIEKCDSIHNCFMRFPIDAVFLDDDNCVVETRSGLKPWISLVLPVKNACKVLELNADFIRKYSIEENDRILFE